MVKTKVITRKDNGVKLKYKVKPDGKLDTGRPTKQTPELIEKLKYALVRNCTETEACAYAEIDPSTLTARKNADPKFSKQIQAWKEMYVQAIKFKSYERAMNTKNKDATEILFKVDKSYSDKQDIDVKGEISLVDIAKQMQQKRLEKEKGEDVK